MHLLTACCIAVSAERFQGTFGNAAIGGPGRGTTLAVDRTTFLSGQTPVGPVLLQPAARPAVPGLPAMPGLALGCRGREACMMRSWSAVPCTPLGRSLAHASELAPVLQLYVNVHTVAHPAGKAAM